MDTIVAGINVHESERHGNAKRFAELHRKEDPLIIANAWDVASARLFERAGFSAIGTTSAGIAASRGYRDGQNIPLSEMLGCIRQIVSAVNVPVSADLEAGFGRDIEETVEIVKQVSSLGSVGINIEDGTSCRETPLVEVKAHTKTIQAIRRAIPIEDLWINARIDVFYQGVLRAQEALQETIRRAHAYLEAGADSIFIFAVNDKDIISTLVQEIKAPINILAGPGIPSIKELKKLGVARVSLGSGPIRATLGLLEEIVDELLSTGTYESLTHRAIFYPALQELL